MEKWWFNSMLFNKKLEYRCGLSKSIDSFGPIEKKSEEPSIVTDNDSYSHVDYLVDVSNRQNFLSDKTFLVRDRNSYSYSIFFAIENKILEIDYDSQFNWKNIINSCIENYLRSQICIDSDILDNSFKYNDNDSDVYSYICGKVTNSSQSTSTDVITITNDSEKESFNDDDDFTQKYKHLWVQCESCYGLNYKKFFKSKMNICEHCGDHLKMSSSDRIELLIDPGTWNPRDEDMVSLDPIEFDPIELDPIELDPIELDSEDEPYKTRLDSYQKRTGLSEAVQTGTGQINGIPVAIGIMDFQFMGGSMGSVVGEKITRLIEYATNQLLPLIIVCASGGARMQEGSLSLMQMAKISSALYNYQINQKLFYVAILTSPTTGGVTASFGMLGDIIIAEPNAYIAFAGKRVIEQTLNTEVPEGSQSAEFLFEKGLFDSIVPRNLLKEVLGELFQFHGFFPLTQNGN
ncbi:acetyl-CoA carboxylase beta subunit (chloroplast) [Cicer arietinum]|uniref:Acetyl-coenzyme A carboxylase carboxyl transferase subunit beta, chloroplastic n=1 Tax=Cicer arietinum TaxID=3827 RepID=ACCD_CICAR|nr:acetyl-CoA carboxylase beta subunit [Cicer arietinum]B5LMN4.1 RecName: Full=Acetyl-coenzyme A carboxylase carboxyl transferase subunit beta, chloroplastic; Short=ACCase subunit beta; Short=Acetyl-CoA carboxylase carboxyltransferase subunit beta [Cicer arietinum]ACH41080.1 acetyl-CoA carboxylase carboxyltransferase beta subunit [Cicer arietinum]